MASYYDFGIDPETNDLSGGYVSGSDEVLQRIRTRLRREYGEWFLNTTEGLPWIGTNGNGILGSKHYNIQNVLLLIRRCIQDTEGVKRVLVLNSTYKPGDRSCSIYCEVLLDTDIIESMTLNFGVES